MLPETRSASTLVVASDAETFLKELVGQDSGLRKSINATTNFKVDPAVANTVGEVVFCDEFFGDVGEADADIFGSIERSTEIEVADVKNDESGALAREDAVDHELDKFKWGGFGTDIAREQMRLPPMVMQVRLGSDFLGRTLQTTLV